MAYDNEAYRGNSKYLFRKSIRIAEDRLNEGIDSLGDAPVKGDYLSIDVDTFIVTDRHFGISSRTLTLKIALV